MDRLMVLGDTGKLGRALKEAFQGSFDVHGRHRASGLDAEDLPGVEGLLRELRPAIVANAVVLSGLDACEREPERAFRVNALFPRHLAMLSRELGFTLIHFSTDAVFDDAKGEHPRVESDVPHPLNVYGATKLAGDHFVQAEARRYYIHRLSVLFGPPGHAPQFVERMLARARDGETLRVADDVFCSPSYSLDVAARVRDVLLEQRPWGLYHTANEGRASLFELLEEVARALHLDAVLERASHAEFDRGIRRSLTTSLASERQKPLREWREAIATLGGVLGDGHDQAGHLLD